MSELTLEGTWEEISNHASELRGRRLRVTVLPEFEEVEAPPVNGVSDGVKEPKAMADLFEGLIGGFHFGDAQLSENSGEKFADELVKKHQEGHL